jgi:hypothetical protein
LSGKGSGEEERNSMNKNPFSEKKSKRILSEKEPTLQGHPITKKQRGLLGFIAGGGKITRRLK